MKEIETIGLKKEILTSFNKKELKSTKQESISAHKPWPVQQTPCIQVY